jgi:hypothetical protein
VTYESASRKSHRHSPIPKTRRIRRAAHTAGMLRSADNGSRRLRSPDKIVIFRNMKLTFSLVNIVLFRFARVSKWGG